MPNFENLGIRIADTHLPARGVDLSRWAVVACDQHTAEPEYWREVDKIVGNAPSTLRLVFPEAFLDQPDRKQRIRGVQDAMIEYLDGGILERHEGLIFVERTLGDKRRRGLLLCFDLEHYDYGTGSTSLIRPTEGTMVERLAPRIEIREGAELEVPHILALIDDPERRVIEPIGREAARLERLYEFDLMLGGGHLAAYAVDAEGTASVVAALSELARPETFAIKYALPDPRPILLFAVGDGNHSLATAKAIWDRTKGSVGMDHPARYALVEVENIHDDGVQFEPIHRIVLGYRHDVVAALRGAFGEDVRFTAVQNMAEMKAAVDTAAPRLQRVGLIRSGARFDIVEFLAPSSNIAVGSLQHFLDRLTSGSDAPKVDYLHGDDVLLRLASQPSNVGFYLAGIAKSELFRTVILEGALPRKTFSMGHAHEKRFYVETRKIRT